MEQPDALLRALARRTYEAIASTVPAGSRVALVNFPNHRNAGDPALWLGGLVAVRRAGGKVGYVCAPETYDPMELQRRLGRRPLVLIGGGGNLGDRYLRQQRARERVLVDFPDGRFVQLPQSIEFGDPGEQARVGRLMADRDLVLMVREHRSEQRAREMGLEPLLVPDTALQLGSLQRPVPPRADLLWQHRTDGEQSRPDLRPSTHVPEGVSFEVRDWLAPLGDDEEPPTCPEWMAHYVEERASNAVEQGRGARIVPTLLRAAYPRMARHWTRRGVRLLGLGRVVVTDRLHGHLLALLTGLPHVVLDNATGKVHDTLKTWTGEHHLAHAASTPEEAVEMALALVRNSS